MGEQLVQTVEADSEESGHERSSKAFPAHLAHEHDLVGLQFTWRFHSEAKYPKFFHSHMLIKSLAS